MKERSRVRETTHIVTTTQEITVEGPDEHGDYRTGDGFYFMSAEGAEDNDSPAHAQAIRQHIASAPKPIQIETIYNQLRDAEKVFGKFYFGETAVGKTDLTEQEAVQLFELLREVTKNV